MAIRRIFSYVMLLLFLNFTLLVSFFQNIPVTLCVILLLGCFYIFYHVFPRNEMATQLRLKILSGGYEILLATMVCFTIEIFLSIFLITSNSEIATPVLIVNGLLFLLFLFLLLLNAIIRIFVSCNQLGILPKISLVLFWWVPIANIFLFRHLLRISGLEYKFATTKQRLNAERKEEELCKTKYPLLMVHGIFFRDWKNFNYWGRVPNELIENGVTLYYGNHQSSAPVDVCALELKQSIEEILQKTGCEKVNIIAHSKGGLDSRYAISCLGMGAYVASLTTINTPHLGCNYVRSILDTVPEKAVSSIGKGYESLYTKLGDDSPDFVRGLQNLTDHECAQLNSNMPNDSRVLYQSIGSYMRSASSAMFPLNIGYTLIKHHGGGKNDGLVSVESMKWGNYLGAISPKGKHGISHADMIDLTRKNIEGFDVCELYVNLVHDLKKNGL